MTGENTGDIITIYWNRQLAGVYFQTGGGSYEKDHCFGVGIVPHGGNGIRGTCGFGIRDYSNHFLLVEADLSDPLFADIEAPQLVAVKAEQVEGGGGGTAAALGFAFGALGAVGGAIYGFVANYGSGPTAAFAGARSGAGYGFIYGAGIGVLIGLAF